MYAIPLLQVAEQTFQCPICYDLYRDPCSLACGHVFCKVCAYRFLDERPQCPLCNKEVRSKRTVTPIANFSLLSSLFRELAPVADGVLPKEPAKSTRVSRIQFDGISTQTSLNPSRSDLSQEPSFTQRLRSPSPPPSSSSSPPQQLTSSIPHLPKDLTLAETPVLPQRVRAVAPPSLSGSWYLELVPPALREKEQSEGPVEARTPGTTALHLNGDCVLCGLNIMDRLSVRRYLKSLLSSPTSDCDAASLSGVTEAQLGAFLGALWEVQCCFVERGRSMVYCTTLAHHNCLAWVGLLHLYTSCLFHAQTRVNQKVVRYPLYLPPPSARQTQDMTVLQKLTLFLTQSANHTVETTRTLESGAGEEQCCYICGRNQITQQLPYLALQPCCKHEQCGRLFHFPCALLAGSRSCLVFGLEERDVDASTAPLDGEEAVVQEKKRPRLEPVVVWCGPCYRQHQSQGGEV